MKNDVVLFGDYAGIIVENKDGVHVVLVDTEDLERIDAAFTSVHVSWNGGANAFYARGHKDGKNTFIHRFVTNAPPGMVVDHLNHRKLDNRKSQLAIKTNQDNQYNRKGCNRNNQTGVLRVSRVGKRYRARARINGKDLYKSFATIEEAQQQLKEWGY